MHFHIQKISQYPELPSVEQCDFVVLKERKSTDVRQNRPWLVFYRASLPYHLLLMAELWVEIALTTVSITNLCK